MLSDNFKQNVCNNRVSTTRLNRKYIYGQVVGELNSSTNRELTSKKQQMDSYIAHLEQELRIQRQKCKIIQQTTLKDQRNVYDQLQIIDKKFNEVELQNNQLKAQLEQSQRQLSQYKNVKGVAQAMINMMQKVQGKSGNYHDAWRWIKKVVWEYETIKKKAFQWKSAYDNQKNQERNDTFSNQSNDSCSSFQNQ